MAETVDGVPRIPVGEWIDTAFDWVDDTFGAVLDSVSDAIASTVGGLADVLNAPSPLLMVAILSLLAGLLGTWKLGIGSLAALTVVVGMDQWEATMTTLASVFFATVLALLIGIPLGICAARWNAVSRVVRPVMDLMQTMPAFVWLVPVVTLFSIGVPAGLVATVIFALPPGVRLTELGIRQVDAEVVEAGHAFGATPRQILRETQLPLALPTVMAGVNQVIMLALSMAVIAGFVGGGGLGSQVTTSISRLDVGLGFEAGLSVVVLAVYLDRLTGALGGGAGSGPLARLRRRTLARGSGRGPAVPATPTGAAQTGAAPTGAAQDAPAASLEKAPTGAGTSEPAATTKGV
ncbi:ABC transporter permease subunit [Nocardioides zeae]|uniref:ABC transporter permease subunit n=1 Tax=Nocardioides imazamoxiresistens TaxID=3231893 RepID=A0ABU3Q0S8_9ACTN|nr:ABC transporter permease subunit [Nocardioides zeae]MDT9595090.1 ABC transporter permease subunit [Nocardioides zeae]